MYAYLQSGEEQAAKTVLHDLNAVSLENKERTIAIDYTLAAAPARYAIELRRWSDAAALTPRPSRFPATEALTHYARALGAAHTGNIPLAREDVQGLAALEDSTYKHPVTPGQLAPARELLGDLLFELQRPAEALAEYEAALRVTPKK